MADGTVYTVTVITATLPTAVVEYDNLRPAIEAWDRVTSAESGVTGGIGVQTRRNGLVVRDGWLLHVREGSTYLSPRIMNEGR